MRATIALFAMTCLLSGTAAAQFEYEFFLVESFDPSYPLASTMMLDINEDNVAVGSDTFGGIIWTEETGKSMLSFGGARSLTNAGFLVYSNSIYELATDQLTMIPAPNAAPMAVAVRHMNDAGVVVGNASTGGSSCEPFDCPFNCSINLVWDAVNGTQTITNVPSLRAFYRVNNSNIAIGQIVTACDNQRGVVYDLNSGTWINLSDSLPPLDVIARPAQTIPTDISDAGHVVGTALWGSEPQHGFIWTEADGYTFLPGLLNGEVDYLYAQGVNSHGTVVGTAAADTWQSGNFEYHAFVWDADNGMRDLNTLAELPPDFILDEALRINDNGWIVGFGHPGPGWATPRGFVLKPIAADVSADLNTDGSVDAADLNILLSEFGNPCAMPSTACGGADFDGDEDVDAADLNVLLSAFGS